MVNLDLKIDPSWFNAEIRNDHYVCRCTKELWAIQLDMLYKVQQICDKHNIKWWIDAGTLLGAVRHRGFIPWDDDVDIVMFREDYDKFLEVARTELKDPYFLQTDWTDKVFYCHTKIRRSDTTGILAKDTLANFDFNQGIFIDIFPMDFVSYASIQSGLKIFLHDTNYSKIKPWMMNVQSTIGYLFKGVIRYFRLPVYKWLDRFFHSDSDNAQSLAYCSEINEMKQFPVKILFPLKESVFEGFNFFIPNDYDTYLRICFGKYMELPSEEERHIHNIGIYPFKPCEHKEIKYWKNEES